MAKDKTDIISTVKDTIQKNTILDSRSACLLMVSGGSDSTALAYIAYALREMGKMRNAAILHVNHKLRGQDAEDDAAFVSKLAERLAFPMFLCEIDIAREAQRTGENVEAVARRERYIAANEALLSLCENTKTPFEHGRILTAHTADDRIENFYMRSIVGTGPGGFRSMLYKNGPVVRPLLDMGREELRDYIRSIDSDYLVEDDAGNLWREDATNAHTDRFRAYVRHNIIPKCKEWNEHFSANLIRSMNLIADEDDMLDEMALDIVGKCTSAIDASGDGLQTKGAKRSAKEPRGDRIAGLEGYANGFLLHPCFGGSEKPLQRRAVHKLLKAMLGQDERIDAQSVNAIINAFDSETKRPISGFVTNIQGNLAVSANKSGVRVERMDAFRARRKKDKKDIR